MGEANRDNKEKTHYEMGIVILLALAGAILVLNRLTISYLLPSVIAEFKISYAQAGALTSVAAITLAFATWFFGGLSDRLGRKIIIVPATILFSVMSWVSGVTYNYLQMFLTRGAMGIGGALVPASIATISAESTPTRRGFNFGLHQAFNLLIALGIGPIAITQLSKIMSWRMVFFIVGIPGLIISTILYFYMKEPKTKLFDQGDERTEAKIEKPGFFAPLRYRNIVISSIVTVSVAGGLSAFLTFSIIYLTKELHIFISEAGIIISFLGFGGCLGCIFLPLLSDHVGRKWVVIPLLFGLGLCYGGVILLSSYFFLLLITFFITGFVLGGIVPLIMSALTTESVPSHLAATASGIPITIGEIFGAALMPLIVGYLCDLYGLRIAIFSAAVISIIGGCAALFYKETAPIKLQVNK